MDEFERQRRAAIRRQHAEVETYTQLYNTSDEWDTASRLLLAMNLPRMAEQYFDALSKASGKPLAHWPACPVCHKAHCGGAVAGRHLRVQKVVILPCPPEDPCDTNDPP